MSIIKNIFDDDVKKRYVFENVIVKIYSNDIMFYIDVDLIYFDDDENVIKSHIKRMLNIIHKSVRSIRKLTLIKNELEIKIYNKEYFENIFTKKMMLFLFFLFIDDFKIYRNMYKTLKVFYWTFLSLLYWKRKKIVNVFILILNFHEVKIENLMNAITRNF